MNRLPNDPVILLGVINMKLRDFYPDLDALCEDMDISRSSLEDKLGKAGFTYENSLNQFR